MEEIGKKHYELLEDMFGLSEEEFDKIVEEDGDELDDLIDDLALREVDDELISDIIDYICGPYD